MIRRAGKIVPRNDPLLGDIVLHPLRSKVEITRDLLEKLEEEQWFS